MQDKNILQSIANNQSLLEAVHEVYERQFLKDEITEEMSDEQIGQISRARITGIKRVGDARREIESYKSVKETPKADNPAY